jgi:hypothetical protein
VTELSGKQQECLAHFAALDDGRGAADGFRFGAGTLSSLLKAGMLERYRGYPWPGANEHNMWRITQAGRTALARVSR